MARELSALGQQPRIEEGGVGWEGDARSIMRANLWLRTASRVVVRIARFRATAFYELEARAKKIVWERHLAADSQADFKVTTHKSKLYHSSAIAERLIKSLPTRASRSVSGPEMPEARPQLFVVRVVRNEFTISADTSGDLLHKRGYRQAIGKAPLRETLAAALLIAADWKGDTPLLDPFCGSGTIPIEAALLARAIPPGLYRRFAFMTWPDYDESIWRSLLAESEKGTLPRARAPILGSDRDRGAIGFAIDNATRARVAGDVQFSVRPLSAIEPPGSQGLVAANPPYGVRVSKGAEVRNLYAQLGNVLRDRCDGWRVALYAPDARLVRETGLRFTEAIRTSNGGIRVSAYRGMVESGRANPSNRQA